MYLIIIKFAQPIMYKSLFKRLSSFICVFFLLNLTGYSVAHAHTYTIGVEDHDYSPYYNFNAQNKGPLRETLDAFAKQEGIYFEYVSLPVKRVNSWYSFDKLDFKLPDNPYWSGYGAVEPVFSAPILYINSATIVLKKNQLAEAQDFKHIAIFEGFIPLEYWQHKIDSGQTLLVEAPSNKLLIQYLYKGLVDGVISDLDALRYQAIELGYDPDDLVVASKFDVKRFGYSLSTIHHRDIIERFNEFLRSYEPANKN